MHAYFAFVLPLVKQLNAAVLFLEALCARREFSALDDVRAGVAELLGSCVQTVAEVSKKQTQQAATTSSLCAALAVVVGGGAIATTNDSSRTTIAEQQN